MNDMTTPVQPAPGLMRALVRLVAETRLVDEDRANEIDHRVRARLAEMSSGLSMLAILLAYLDWASHVAISPGKRLRMREDLIRKLISLGIYNATTLLRIESKPPVSITDRRLKGEHWDRWPFNVWAQGWQISKEYWAEATRDVSGARKDNLELVAFLYDQALETMSPANFPLTNPEVIQTSIKERGRNLIRGLSHAADDLRRRRNKKPVPGTERFQVGKDVACTPGKVIYQNQLIELIQYSPQTEKVDAEPVMIVPAWIMKFYILDLSPKNSMVRYLLEQGKTVFLVSWKNPDRGDSALSMTDYLKLGILEPLSAINAIVPKRRVNAVGYCIGGSLLYIAAAHLAGSEQRFNTVSIFAAQADFSEPGEIRSLLGESNLSQLESLMRKRGVLESGQMGSAFASLRSGDLIWGPKVDRYLLGKEPAMNDLMAWNADGTRLPYRMHAEYLRRLYMDNDLAEGRFDVDGRVISLTDVTTPMFVVGTVTDHVAPWKSVFKIHRLTGGEITFMLTTGGHNAGIVSGPSHPRRKHQIHTRNPGDLSMDPDTWQAKVRVRDGSWWPAWNAWLEERTSGRVKPPSMGAARKGYKVLRDAPGEYVLVR